MFFNIINVCNSLSPSVKCDHYNCHISCVARVIIQRHFHCAKKLIYVFIKTVVSGDIPDWSFSLSFVRRSPLEELSSFERSSHFYDREREASYRGRPTASGYHVVSPIQGSPDPLRTRTRERTVFRAYPHER